MDETKAGQIYDYIEKNQDTIFTILANELGTNVETARRYTVLWAAYSKEQFIKELTK